MSLNIHFNTVNGALRTNVSPTAKAIIANLLLTVLLAIVHNFLTRSHWKGTTGRMLGLFPADGLGIGNSFSRSANF